MTLSIAGSAVQAAVPSLSSLFPAGGQTGSQFTLTTNGKSDDKTRFWTDAPGLEILPAGKPNEWTASIAKETPAGLYQIRLFNPEGASELRWFSVGHLPEITEVEPNDENGKGHLIEKLPVCVNARLEKSGDVDGYRIQLKKDQTIIARVEAYALGSPVDMISHIVDQNGTRLLTGSDDRNLDPFLVFTAPEAGTYTLQLAGFAHPPQANVAFAGDKNIVYRLQLSHGPVVTHAYPAAVLVGQEKGELSLRGHIWNKDQTEAKVAVDPKSIRRHHQGLALVDVPNAFTSLQVVSAKAAPLAEKEPNDQATEAMPVKVDSWTGGVILKRRDTDRFSLEMKKGQRMEARIYAKVLGSPLDATLQVFAPDGKSVALADDAGDQFDPSVLWTAAVDGVHQIVVTDTLSQGGADHHYVLKLAAPAPDCQVTLTDAAPLTLARGKTVSVKVNVKRLNRLEGALVLRASGLPASVKADEVSVPEKGGEVEFKLTAAADAAPSQQPIRLAVRDKHEPATAYPAIAPLRGENLRGTSLLDTTPDLWLTVTEK